MEKETEAKLYFVAGLIIFLVGIAFDINYYFATPFIETIWAHGRVNGGEILLVTLYPVFGLYIMWYWGLKNISYVDKKRRTMEELDDAIR